MDDYLDDDDDMDDTCWNQESLDYMTLTQDEIGDILKQIYLKE
jgi:hypothetical protein